MTVKCHRRMTETVIFPSEHERCFAYESKEDIVDEIHLLLEDNDAVTIMESIDFRVEEASYENKTLYRCSKTEKERENELNGLRNNKVYFTYTYFHKREDGYVPKTYGPGAYFLEGISPYVYENNPFVHHVVYTGTKTQRILELTVTEYNHSVVELWLCLCRKKINASPNILFSAYIKNVKNIDVLKITGSDYEYPIVILL